MANYVLVHGAWVGSWTWGEMPARLRAAGHQVLCPDLPGMGTRVAEKHGGISLSDHIADVVRQVEEAGFERFILAGHSYGGMVITGVTSRLGGKIDAIAYLDAFVPENGMCLWDFAGPAERESNIETQKHTPGLVAPLPWLGEGLLDLPGFSRQPLLTFVEAVERDAAWDSIARKAFAFALGFDRSPFAGTAAQLRDDPAWEYYDLDCGHVVMMERPDETFAILDGLAG